MKKLYFSLLVALFCANLFASELWSGRVAFDGSEITSTPITLLKTDEIFYSTALADGEPQSLTLTAQDTVDASKVASIFSDNSGNAVEGTAVWDYSDEAYDDFSKSDVYELKETIVTDKGTVNLTRNVKILPEPACLLLLGLLSLFFLRRQKGLMLVLICASLGAFADATVTSVNAKQAWPFKRSVVINYAFNTDTTSGMPVFSVSFYGTLDDGETVFDLSERGTLEKDGAEGVLFEAGQHKAIWTPDSSFNSVKTNDLKIKVKVNEVTANANYLVFDLSNSKVRVSATGPDLSDNDCRTKELWMKRIEPDSFIMGSPTTELGRDPDETEHAVAITEPYYIAIFETTQKQHEYVTGEGHGCIHVGDTLPVEYICYHELRGSEQGAQWPQSHDVDAEYNDHPTFFHNIREQFSNQFLFDLPTEAMWEFACRAGTTTAWNDGTDSEVLDQDPNLEDLGWYMFNAINNTYPPGQKTPNAWGLYDMHGNVWEWCLDWYDDYSSASVEDPKGPATGETRVIRSGSWYQYSQFCRSAERRGNLPWHPGDDYFGFRAALYPPAKTYMVIDLAGGTSATSYPVSYISDVPEGGWTDEYKTTKLVLRLIEPGTFAMGSPDGEVGRDSGEIRHNVTLTRSYYAGIFEVTQKQYQLVTGSNPADLNIGERYPVEQVSYDMVRGATQGALWPESDSVDSDSFLGRLRAKTGLTFDLPTEAQWEYACRATTTTALNSGKNLTSTTVCANVAEVGRYTHNTNDGKGNNYVKPGLYKPNKWGLYDCHGNLDELCRDYYGAYSAADQTDPEGPAAGTERLIRGGSWVDNASECRSARRVPVDSNYHAQHIGFRVMVTQ